MAIVFTEITKGSTIKKDRQGHTASRKFIAIGTSTGALKVLRVALAGIGIGLIIAGVVLLKALYAQKKCTKLMQITNYNSLLT